MKKFVWGKIVNCIVLDMDGKLLEIIKYKPFLLSSKITSEEISYHIAELSESWTTFEGAVIGWMVRQHLGQNHGAVTSAICRILKVKS